MTHLEFCHWFDGYFTLSPNKSLSFKQLTVIFNHLALAETVSGPLSTTLLQLKQLLIPLLDKGDKASLQQCEVIKILIAKGLRGDLPSLR